MMVWRNDWTLDRRLEEQLNHWMERKAGGLWGLNLVLKRPMECCSHGQNAVRVIRRARFNSTGNSTGLLQCWKAVNKNRDRLNRRGGRGAIEHQGQNLEGAE